VPLAEKSGLCRPPFRTSFLSPSLSTSVVRLSFASRRKRHNHINIGADRLASSAFLLNPFLASFPDLLPHFNRWTFHELARKMKIATTMPPKLINQLPSATAVEDDSQPARRWQCSDADGTSSDNELYCWRIRSDLCCQWALWLMMMKPTLRVL
jgi:hypothetical protein